MSYRTVKRLLGETSLERKCRFLFGGGLMLLITGSFYFYAWRNSTLVYSQNQTTGKMLVPSVVLWEHWRTLEADDFRPVIEELAASLKPDGLRDYSYRLLSADPETAEPGRRPDDETGYDALEAMRRGELTEYIDIDDSKGEYYYYGALHASRSCLHCHATINPGLKEGELMGMVKITFPLETTRQALNYNNAVLIATAIVTAFLAMLGLYAGVRYVIVKPVLHLKEVSDEIARGTLDLRADIRTGDEFEELSHAFNRMLRHLTTVQEELRQVNTDLDAKVDELAQVNLRLYEMNKIKNEFLATMSHELRTPLNSILGFSDVLSGADNLNERQKRFVKNIQTSGRELMALINDVLDLAKIESGKMERQIVEFSIRDLVERQVGAMMPMAERKNIDLTWQTGPDLPLVMQDPGKLQQILNNLLSNAIKFTPEGGRVRVWAGLAEDGKTLELTVEDTGIGIPLEDQDTIFEKFRQGRSIPGQRDAMTREYGGTGLGLSIVKELSKLLGGEVLLDSEFGKGSTFMIRVPARLDEQPQRLDEDLRARTIGLAGSRRDGAPARDRGTEGEQSGSREPDESAA